MKKILVFEDETKVGGIKSIVEARARTYSREAIRVRRVAEALPHLARGDINLVIIHHYDFSDVDELRKKFPKVKYAGYSGDLRVALECGGNDPRTAGAEFIRKFAEHYDFSLRDMGARLDEILLGEA